MLRRSVLLITLALVCAGPAFAQLEAPPAVTDSAGQPQARLPAAVSTRHDVALPGRTLSFSATAGAITVTDEVGNAQGEIGFVAYVLDGQPAGSRPVTFAVNGGPGASSAWLHVGALGPWRLPLAPGADALVPNAETWLDFTDLVFIDPPGTGYARPFGATVQPAREGTRRGRPRSGAPGTPDTGDNARQLWSVAGDTSAIASAMQSWLTDNQRLSSPRMLVGESYGGFRAPRIGALLLRRKLPLDAVVLVSPVIDFEGRRSSFGPLPYVYVLPSIAAVEMERRGTPPTRDRLAEVETLARTDFLVDLLAGPRDARASARVAERMREITGLPATVVEKSGGRINGFAYARESLRADGRIASVYDASVTAADPGGQRPRGDPFLAPMSEPLTTAMVALYRDRLGWIVDRPYELQSTDVLRGWNWPNSPNPPEAMAALANVLGHPGARVLVTHGFSDLVTPYFASAVQLSQLAAAEESRVELKVYPGGHMFYSRDASRREFRADAQRLLADRQLLPSP